MKKLLFIFALVSIFSTIPIFPDILNMQHDDGELIYWCYGADYWAVRYYVADTCTLNTVSWGRYTKRDEYDSILVFDNFAGNTNNLLYSTEVIVNTGKVTSVISYDLTDTVLVMDTFWIVIFARTQDIPADDRAYFVCDSTPGIHSYYGNTSGGPWTQDPDGDYIVRLVLTGPASALMLNENPELQKIEYPQLTIGPEPSVFSTSTRFSLGFSNEDYLSVRIYDKLGKLVAVIHDDYISPGRYDFNWNGTDDNGNRVQSGPYYILVKSMKNDWKYKVLYFSH